MVQEKDAAAKRVAKRKQFEREAKERWDNSILQTVWYCVEVRPGYNTGGYYDTDVPQEERVVSPAFDTRKKAEAWMSEHEADKGKYLTVGYKHLRKIEYKDWTGLYLVRKV